MKILTRIWGISSTIHNGRVGDDLHALLVGLLHSLSSSDLRLDLQNDLIHLNTYQLAQEWEPWVTLRLGNPLSL